MKSQAGNERTPRDRVYTTQNRPCRRARWTAHLRMKYVAATTAPNPKITPRAVPAFALPDSPCELEVDALGSALALGVGFEPDVVLGLPPYGQ